MCVGDDVYNGVYRIEMPNDATLGDLLHVLLYSLSGQVLEVLPGDVRRMPGGELWHVK